MCELEASNNTERSNKIETLMYIHSHAGPAIKSEKLKKAQVYFLSVKSFMNT